MTMTMISLAEARGELTRPGMLPACAVDRAAGVHVLRPGMTMRWSADGVGPEEKFPQSAPEAGEVCFVFALHDPRAQGAADCGEDGAGATGWMTALRRTDLGRLSEMMRAVACHVVVELSREMRREIFHPGDRERGAGDFELPDFDGTPSLLPLTPAARLAVESVRRCPLAGACRTLILSARCHDLLVAFISAQGATESRPLKPVSLMADTETRVRQAAAALALHLDETPSLDALAREVGLSETTLKRGFHQVFGTTVFSHLRTLRMERARGLLQSGEATVIEAATLVGYSNPSNFACAFRRQFGLNPKEFQLAARR